MDFMFVSSGFNIVAPSLSLSLPLPCVCFDLGVMLKQHYDRHGQYAIALAKAIQQNPEVAQFYFVKVGFYT